WRRSETASRAAIVEDKYLCDKSFATVKCFLRCSSARLAGQSRESMLQGSLFRLWLSAGKRKRVLGTALPALCHYKRLKAWAINSLQNLQRETMKNFRIQTNDLSIDARERAGWHNLPAILASLRLPTLGATRRGRVKFFLVKRAW